MLRKKAAIKMCIQFSSPYYIPAFFVVNCQEKRAGRWRAVYCYDTAVVINLVVMRTSFSMNGRLASQ